MDDRKMIASEFINEGHTIAKVLKILKVPESSWYYKAKGGQRGRKKSTFTLIAGGGWVPNSQVVNEIGELLEEEFVDYGYLKVTHWLRQEKNYIINPKKVYRLMREAKLLHKATPKKRRNRNWVEELVPPAEQPFDYLEFDIKYMWVTGLRKNVLILTVIDVRTRWILGQYLSLDIKQHHVIGLFDQLFDTYPLPKHFYVRNDNGSQFEAQTVQRYFEEKGVTQEFCKPATPEQNAHVESYHSIMESVICQKYEFENLKDIRDTMNRFVKFYNFRRIHSGVGYTSPYKCLRGFDIDMGLYDLEDALDCSFVKAKSKAPKAK